MDKDAFKKKLEQLVEVFDRNKDIYKSRTSNFNEAQLRIQFLDPMFKAMGWDMNNDQGFAEQYKEVVHEDKVLIHGKPKAPDYSFRVGGQRKYFLEAKQPFVKIKTDYDPALQLRRYAWSAHLPISVLTDFEEFAVYDTTIEPKASDNASTARIKYYTYDQYLDVIDDIYDTFAKDSILRGSFDKYASKEKRGTQVVDKVFLKEIENWREWLAKDLAIHNPNISVKQLNYAVQKIIDRLIFLRIAEDRGIETYKTLEHIISSDSSYPELVRYFKQSQEKYNSGLFDFEEDQITPNLTVSDRLLDKILNHLYYPNSPYEFSVLGVELLGSIYEQFLGKVIRLTTGHSAKVEEKLEVKKSGGVYYTPQYIVEHIVQTTVGDLLVGKTPKQVEKIKILDPACGSGSFLIGAYEYLLNWHLNYYQTLTDKEKSALEKKGVLYKQINKESTGKSTETLQLTTSEKKRIMLNNIYGVDIDEQAVEVTKLSLALKMLENENQESLTAQLRLFAERILPDMSKNIKNGNSLIEKDFYDTFPIDQLSEEVIASTKVFNWRDEFKDIFKNGGFDCVIGNPPYLRIQGLQEYYKEQIQYYQQKYVSAVKRFDLYLLFMEKGFSLLNKNGVLGYINPHKFVNGDFGSGIRDFLIKNKALESIVSFGSYPVFESASTYTGIMKLSKENRDSFKFYEISSKTEITVQDELNHITDEDFTIYKYDLLSNAPWSLTNQITQEILNKIQKVGKPLENFFEEIAQGVVTGIDDIYFLQITNNTDLTKEVTKVYSARTKDEVEIESKIIKPTLKGEDVSRFVKSQANIVCIYPYKEEDGKTKILEPDELQSLFPFAHKYLNNFKSELIGIRKAYKTNPKYWYSCHRGRKISLFESLRVITPEISLGCNMTIGEPGIYHNTMVYSLLPKATTQEDFHYWLGLLNSNLLWWFLTNTGNVLRGGYFRFKTNYLKPFPARTIDFKNSEDKKYHDSMVEAVKKLLAIHSKLKGASGEMSVILKQQASKAENELNTAVYKLYGLNQKEIEIIEAALPK